MNDLSPGFCKKFYEKPFSNIRKERNRGVLRELNNYGMEMVILEYETKKESLCHTRRDSMLMEPFTMSSSRGSQSTGSYDIRDL